MQREEHPQAPFWGLQEQLLAELVDSAAWLIWSKTDNGKKNRNRPKPIPRPGVPDTNQMGEGERRIGSDAVPLDELDDFLQWEHEVRAKPPRPRDARGRFIKTTPD